MSRASLKPARIRAVLPGSLAETVGIQPGDALVRINGEQPRDLIDYRFLITEEELELEILQADGNLYRVTLEKELDEDLGLEFETALFDSLIQCTNACPFCFIDQQPPEMRATLHLKDDDYRLSFLYGSYLTLTNLPAAEWERIARLRLSPLYVSVHATEPELRSRLLKNPRAGLILDQLAWFQEHRLQLHAQVVVCPGWNDADHLTRTLLDLATFHRSQDGIPTVLSTAVVPVGLTRFRPPEDEIVPVDAAKAQEVIRQVEGLQAQFRQELGSTFAWLADEWYLLAGWELPPAEHYEDYPQLGNGVGSLRLFLSQFEQVSLPTGLTAPLKGLWLVGNAVGQAFQPIVQRMNRIPNLQITLLPIASQFWGQTLTVTGLLTGQDVLRALHSVPNLADYDVLLLPQVTLKDGERFLDDLTWQELQAQVGIPVVRVEGGPAGLVQAVQQGIG
ncbi:TIGR03279 family radical SAM protein [Thermostichus vulcanus]|uniref:TIGR03279 family radical SAM protein n=1 Tax=Thermostichus vulcanus str. 'Rupite' TaxID=2813851 RepID=A0ABT0CFM5_THEVL|nr:TIGR03279 family radical SAM protein [Thermostichus vulcanus]MCJ2544582.1 TIGR03279 family radical SAM protein [Thermostichus vulcanus str. 'Rupite']